MAASFSLTWLRLATSSSARIRGRQPYLIVRKILYVIDGPRTTISNIGRSRWWNGRKSTGKKFWHRFIDHLAKARMRKVSSSRWIRNPGAAGQSSLTSPLTPAASARHPVPSTRSSTCVGTGSSSPTTTPPTRASCSIRACPRRSSASGRSSSRWPTPARRSCGRRSAARPLAALGAATGRRGLAKAGGRAVGVLRRRHARHRRRGRSCQARTTTAPASSRC